MTGVLLELVVTLETVVLGTVTPTAAALKVKNDPPIIAVLKLTSLFNLTARENMPPMTSISPSG